VEWKSYGDDYGGGEITELLTAPPANTSSQMESSHSDEGVDTIETTNGLAGRVHPNGHTSRGDGARGHRVNPPDTFILCPSAAILIKKIVLFVNSSIQAVNYPALTDGVSGEKDEGESWRRIMKDAERIQGISVLSAS
jgi:hypothetical protein